MQAFLSEIEGGGRFSFPSMDTIASRIKYLREMHRLTQEEFAAGLEVKRGSVGNWELGGGISRVNLEKIASRYGVSIDWLQRGTGVAPEAPARPQLVNHRRPHQNALLPPALAPGAPTIPILGQGAAGPDGRFPFNGEEVARIAAPPRLAGVRHAYALYVVGDSMENRYFNGEIVYVDPHRRPTPGPRSFVVAQIAGEEGEPPSGYIKRLAAWNDLELRLEQFNPRKLLRFPAKKIVSVHRIIMGGEE